MTAQVAIAAALSLALSRLLVWAAPLRIVVRSSPLAWLNLHPADPLLLAETVERVAGRMPRMTCLVRALALRWLLDGLGLSSRLVIGVQAGGTAHAWLEHYSVVLIGGPVSEFKPIFQHHRGACTPHGSGEAS